MTKKILMSKDVAGRKGGLATLKRYGRDQLTEWGKRGGRPRSPNYDEIRQRQLLEQNNNHKEVITGPPGNLRQLRRSYKLRRRSSDINQIPEAGIAQVNPKQAIPAGEEAR